MQKLREDINELLAKAEAKLYLVEEKNKGLKESVQFLNQVCCIVTQSQTPLKGGANKQNWLGSPTEGTHTTASERPL